MPIYATAIIPLILMLLEITNGKTKVAAYADDFSAAGSVLNLKSWWEKLCTLGPKFGYYPEASKSWLIVKPKHKGAAATVFNNSKINITTEGKRHLGAVIGSESYKEQYISEKINEWKDELHVLSEIAKIEPQAAYSCFTSGYKHKFNYCMRTIPNISHLMKEIDEIIMHEFIPAITGGVKINEMERNLLALPPKLEGLGTYFRC